MEDTTFDNNFANFNLDATKFGTLKDIAEIDKSQDFGAMETIFEFLNYLNVCIYKNGLTQYQYNS